jgi:tRNA-binding protein
MKEEITWPDFEKIDVRVGTVQSAEVFEGARKAAYILQIDFGALGVKKTSAQLTARYLPEALVGTQVLAVVNFPKKQIASIQSECLVLGVVGANGDVVLLRPDFGVENGLPIG